ncbi:MAG: hypothetical protein HY291_08485 [Planctomycetes bacterium]|nr:hypothetical protein [Planctomycetota bacterium]
MQPAKSRRFQFSLRTLLIAVCLIGLYGSLWCITARWGCSNVKGSILADFVRETPELNVLDYNPFQTELPNGKPSRPQMPWCYAQEEISPCPFIVRIDSGVMIGKLCGGGSRTYYFWFFGYRRFLFASNGWMS